MDDIIQVVKNCSLCDNFNTVYIRESQASINLPFICGECHMKEHIKRGDKCRYCEEETKNT